LTQIDKRTELLTRDGQQGLDTETLRAVQDGLRKELLARKIWYSSGTGPRYRGCATSRCFDVGIGPCDLKLDELATLVDRELEKRGVPDAAMEVVVEINGEVEPRCEPDDPKCGPIDEARSYQSVVATGPCSSERKPLDERKPRPLGQTHPDHCAYDGECTLLCEACVRWTQVRGQVGCMDFLEERPRGSYCGCVAGACGWFRP